MDQVEKQYEAYPYPERDPADETRRLLTGSPSDPLELDHILFDGSRDWSRPFRVMIAGGGTGDATIMMAQRLADVGCPADILYVDQSEAAMRIARGRAEVRGLTNIRFRLGSLLNAAEFGPFDYIDCCGVLHHLPDPQMGARALADALAPDGALGLMVYAPDGRRGVYPLQEAFALLAPDGTPESRLDLGKAVLGVLPKTHEFHDNSFVTDHKISDAGFYDLLLHSRDRSYRIEEIVAVVEQAGLRFVGVPEPADYDPAPMLPQRSDVAARLKEMTGLERMSLAERLSGAHKKHIIYAVKSDKAPRPAGTAPHLVPRLKGVSADLLAREIKKRGSVVMTNDIGKKRIVLPPSTAPIIADLSGRLTLGQIAEKRKAEWFGFAGTMARIESVLCGHGLLKYSRTFK